MKKYYEQLFANKLGKLDEIGKFLGRHKWPKLTQEEIKSLHRLVTSKKIELLIKKLPILSENIRGGNMFQLILLRPVLL